MQLADNADPDQSAHSRRLIRACVVRLQKQWEFEVYVDERRMSKSDCTSRHAHLDFAVRKWHKGLFPTICIIWSGSYGSCIFLRPNKVHHVQFRILIWAALIFF